MAADRPHTYAMIRLGQKQRYAALSRGLTVLAQLPECFLSPDHQDYQAVIAENVSGMRA